MPSESNLGEANRVQSKENRVQRTENREQSKENRAKIIAYLSFRTDVRNLVFCNILRFIDNAALP